MTSTAFAPATHSGSDAWPAADTTLELVSGARTASSRVAVRVLIASHQPIVRYGLWDVIAGEPDLQVVGEADDGREAVRLARQLRPDVVLMDLTMPGVDGISATRMIRSELHDTQVVVMTGVDADSTAVEAIRAGAAAYLLRDSQIDDLLRTIRGAGTGQVALPAEMAARMIRHMGGHEVLSHREVDVLHLVARGLANKQVARELSIDGQDAHRQPHEQARPAESHPACPVRRPNGSGGARPGRGDRRAARAGRRVSGGPAARAGGPIRGLAGGHAGVRIVMQRGGRRSYTSGRPRGVIEIERAPESFGKAGRPAPA